ncbi:MAG: hypothetical protein ABIR25_05775 [Sphingomicrobium sp.]
MSLTFQPFPFELSGLAEWVVETAKREITVAREPADISIIEPLPAYYADARRFILEGPEAATRTGWRTIVLASDQPISLLDIGLSRAGEPQYATRDGASAVALEQALLMAARAGSREDYEVRWLSLADIYVTTVWLEGEKQLFIPTRLGGAERVEAKILNLSELQELVDRLVRKQVDSSPQESARRQWSARSPTSGLPPE